MYTDVVAHCGTDHSSWYKSLVFYKDDLQTLENRLQEIVKKNTAKELMAEVEHFQNQFILQKNNIDELLHTINDHNEKVTSDARLHAGKMQGNLVKQHGELEEQVEQLEKLINTLRHEFNRFLCKWM